MVKTATNSESKTLSPESTGIPPRYGRLKSTPSSRNTTEPPQSHLLGLGLFDQACHFHFNQANPRSYFFLYRHFFLYFWYISISSLRQKG